MEFENETLVSVKLITKYERYQIGTSAISLPIRFSRYELSRLVNEALGLEKPVPFDFILEGKLLRVPLSEYMSTHGISAETTISLEYVPIISRPEEKSTEELPDWVSSLACNGEFYTAGCYDGTVHVYDMNDNLLCKTATHKKPVKAVDCCKTAKSSLVASASVDNTVRLQQLQNGSLKPLVTLTGHDSHVMNCKFSPDARLLVSSAWNGSILVWDIEKGLHEQKGGEEWEPVHSLSESLQGVTALSWMGQKVISGGWDHHIRIWDLETEGMISDLRGNKVVNQVDYCNMNNLMVTCHPDGVRLWDARQEKANILTFAGMRNWTSDIEWHPSDSNLLVATDYEGCLAIYDIRSSFAIHSIPKVHEGKVLCTTWKNANEILTGGEDKKMKRMTVSESL